VKNTTVEEIEADKAIVIEVMTLLNKSKDGVLVRAVACYLLGWSDSSGEDLFDLSHRFFSAVIADATMIKVERECDA
jgi:hypothetical protein